MEYRIIGSHTIVSVEPDACEKCHNAEWGGVMVNRICGKCLVEDAAALREQLAEARELLAIFAEQADLIAHVTCDDDCEYQQAKAYLAKYKDAE